MRFFTVDNSPDNVVIQSWVKSASWCGPGRRRATHGIHSNDPTSGVSNQDDFGLRTGVGIVTDVRDHLRSSYHHFVESTRVVLWVR